MYNYKKFHVENMISVRSGCPTRNQFVITIKTKKGIIEVFQSYNTTIAVKDENGQITLDKNYWDCSVTTSTYRGRFLGENTKETRKKIEKGIYKLSDLN